MDTILAYSKLEAGMLTLKDKTYNFYELRDPLSGEFLNDDITGYSIAVALREAIAASLGIQTEELGCDCHPIRVEDRTARAIRVFDLCAPKQIIV